MGRRRSAEPLIKVTMNLVKSDYELLQEYYAAGGAAAAIRQILSIHCRKVRERAGTPITLDLDINIDEVTEAMEAEA